MVADVIAKIAEEQKEWGQHFPQVPFALRVSTHEYRVLPKVLMFDMELRLPIDAKRAGVAADLDPPRRFGPPTKLSF